MKKFTIDNIIEWITLVDAGFAPDPMTTQTKVLNRYNVLDFFTNLIGFVENLNPQVLNNLVILEQVDVPIETDISDALVIAYNPDLEELTRESKTSRRGRRTQLMASYRFPPKTALVFNLYPHMYQENPNPFLLVTEYWNGARTKDVSIPIFIGNALWDKTIKQLYTAFQDPTNNLLMMPGQNEENFIKNTLGYGLNRYVLSLVESHKEEAFSLVVTRFFEKVDQLLTAPKRTEEERRSKSLRSAQKKRKRELDAELMSQMQEYGFDTIEELFEFENQLEELSQQEQSNLRVRQRQYAKAKSLDATIDRLRTELISYYNLPTVWGRPFEDPNDILDSLIEPTRKMIRQQRRWEIIQESRPDIINAIKNLKRIREAKRNQEALGKEYSLEPRDQNKIPEWTRLEKQAEQLDLDDQINEPTMLEIVREIQKRTAEIYKNSLPRRNPKRSRNALGVLMAAGAGYWFANRNK